ncbi:hypothetical protein [Photobacterium damselae]|uniref:hypothetical protein n=1 Tax=Photobacterium damselae TaxID=38293 RepID=UPI00370ABFA9
MKIKLALTIDDLLATLDRLSQVGKDYQNIVELMETRPLACIYVALDEALEALGQDHDDLYSEVVKRVRMLQDKHDFFPYWTLSDSEIMQSIPLLYNGNGYTSTYDQIKALL